MICEETLRFLCGGVRRSRRVSVRRSRIQVESVTGESFNYRPGILFRVEVKERVAVPVAGIVYPVAVSLFGEHRALTAFYNDLRGVECVLEVGRSRNQDSVFIRIIRFVIRKGNGVFSQVVGREIGPFFPHDHVRIGLGDFIDCDRSGNIFAVKPVEAYPIGRNVFSGNVLRVESFHNGKIRAQAGYAVGYLVSVFIRQFDRGVFARQIHRGRRCRRIYQRCVFGDVDRYFDGRFVDLGRSEVDQDLSGRLIDFSVDRRAVVGCLKRFYERIDYGGYLIRNREIVHNDIDRGGILQIQRFAYGAALVIYRCAFDQREGYRNGLYIHRSGIIQFDGCILFVEAYFGDIVRFDF